MVQQTESSILFPNLRKLRRHLHPHPDAKLASLSNTQEQSAHTRVRRAGEQRTSPGSSTRCFVAGSGSSAFRLISSSRSGRPRRNLRCENSHVCTSAEVRCARGVCGRRERARQYGRGQAGRVSWHDADRQEMMSRAAVSVRTDGASGAGELQPINSVRRGALLRSGNIWKRTHGRVHDTRRACTNAEGAAVGR